MICDAYCALSLLLWFWDWVLVWSWLAILEVSADILPSQCPAVLLSSTHVCCCRTPGRCRCSDGRRTGPRSRPSIPPPDGCTCRTPQPQGWHERMWDVGTWGSGSSATSASPPPATPPRTHREGRGRILSQSASFPSPSPEYSTNTQRLLIDRTKDGAEVYLCGFVSVTGRSPAVQTTFYFCNCLSGYLQPEPLAGRVLLVGRPRCVQVERRVEPHQLQLPPRQVDLVIPAPIMLLHGSLATAFITDLRDENCCVLKYLVWLRMPALLWALPWPL